MYARKTSFRRRVQKVAGAAVVRSRTARMENDKQARTSTRRGCFSPEKLMLSIDDLIDNRRGHPLTRDNFRLFLAETHNEVRTNGCPFRPSCLPTHAPCVAQECIDFLAATAEWKRRDAASGSAANDDTAAKLLAAATVLVEDFIAPGAAREVNISSATRRSVQEAVRTATEAKAVAAAAAHAARLPRALVRATASTDRVTGGGSERSIGGDGDAGDGGALWRVPDDVFDDASAEVRRSNVIRM